MGQCRDMLANETRAEMTSLVAGGGPKNKVLDIEISGSIGPDV